MTRPIEDTTAALRRHLAASPHDIQALLDLAGALAERVDADETRAPEAADLDEPIELLRTAAGLAADEDPELHTAILLDLVDLLRLRFDVQGELGDLSTAIAYEQQILHTLVAEGEDQTGVLYQLGLDFAVRHDQQADTAQDDLRQAIACLRELRALISDDHPGRPELANRLGLMLGYSVLQTVEESSDEDFAETVKELTLARNAPIPEEDLTEADVADAWLVRFRLGMLRAFRYLDRGGDAQDRDVAIAELNELTNHPNTPIDQADRCHLTLALLEYMRAVPAELRRGPELLTKDEQTRLWEMMSSFTAKNSADTARHHLDAMSESSAADPQLSLLIRGLRAGTLTHDNPKDGTISTGELTDTASGSMTRLPNSPHLASRTSWPS